MKVNYVTVYCWQVLSTLKEGKEVYCHDKGVHEVFDLNTMPVKSVIAMINESEKDKNYGRYEFYYVEKVKEGKNDAETV